MIEYKQIQGASRTRRTFPHAKGQIQETEERSSVFLRLLWLRRGGIKNVGTVECAGWPWDGTVAHVAQMVERVLGKDEVIGSIPIVGSRQRGAFMDQAEDDVIRIGESGKTGGEHGQK